jgi:hypothetical protein
MARRSLSGKPQKISFMFGSTVMTLPLELTLTILWAQSIRSGLNCLDNCRSFCLDTKISSKPSTLAQNCMKNSLWKSSNSLIRAQLNSYNFGAGLDFELSTGSKPQKSGSKVSTIAVRPVATIVQPESSFKIFILFCLCLLTIPRLLPFLFQAYNSASPSPLPQMRPCQN